MRFRVLIGLGMVIALVAVSTGAGAATVLGGSRISSLRATDWESAPAVAWNETANQYLVVWEDDRNWATRGHDIYGRRVGANGRPLGRDFRVSGPADTLNEADPAVVWNAAADEYLVVWREYEVVGESTRYYDVWGRRIAANGARLGVPFTISTPGSRANAPGVAYNSTSTQYLVVWPDLRNSATSSWDIYGRRVLSDGRLLGGDFRISSDPPGEEDPAVAYNASRNRFVVVWGTWNADAILGQQLSTRGALVGGQVQISSPASTSALLPDVACARSVNKCLVVWHGESATENYTDILGQRVRSDLAHAASDLLISGPEASKDEYRPEVAWNQTAGRFLVVWNDNRDYQFTGRDDIYGREVGVTGKLTDLGFRINPRTATGFRGDPAVAANPTTNEYLVVWEDWRAYETRGSDLFDRRVAG